MSTAIIIFTKGGKTDNVWFYDLQADGFSLDDKRTPLKGDGSNDLPDAIAQWNVYRELVEKNHDFNADLGDDVQGGTNPGNAGANFRDKTQKAFLVSADDIRANKYDLSINRYKEVVYEEEEYEDPKVILQKLKTLENDILNDLAELENML